METPCTLVETGSDKMREMGLLLQIKYNFVILML